MKKQNGITLIALVITIIVLLILAGVSISAVIGENGIADKAKESNKKTEIAKIKESISIDIAEVQTENEGNLSETELNTILAEYGTMTEDDSKFILITEKGLEIDITDIISRLSFEQDNFVDISELNVGDYISNYPVEYVNVTCGDVWSMEGDEYNPASDTDYGTGWRVLSKETNENGNICVKLVSEGVPVNRYSVNSDVDTLLDNFLLTTISSTFTRGCFYDCGIKNIGTDTTLVNVFNNDFTEHVRSLSEEDIENLIGVTLEYGDEILNVIEGEKLDMYLSLLGNTGKVWLPADGYECYLDSADESGRIWSVGEIMMGNAVLGVRIVVTLNENVKFSEATNQINDTATWEISL